MADVKNFSLKEARANAQKVCSGFSTDDSYIDDQNCGAGILDLDVKLEIGVWRTGYTCPDIYDWYEFGKDLTLVEREGETNVNREDVDGTTGYKQTSSGQVERTRTMTIKPNWGSKFYQKLADIHQRDSLGGYNGNLFRNYSDGGFAFRITYTQKDGSFGAREISLNVKAENFGDPYFTDFTSPDAELELNFMIEFSPLYEFEGIWPRNYGIPTAISDITIDYVGVSWTATTATFSGVTITDTDTYLTSDEVYIQILNKTDGSLLGSGSGSSAGNIVINGTYTETDEVIVKMGYVMVEGVCSYYVDSKEEVVNFTAPSVTVDLTTPQTVANDFVVNETALQVLFGVTLTGGTNPVVSNVDLGGASTGATGTYTITFTGSNDEGGTGQNTGELTIQPPAITIDVTTTTVTQTEAQAVNNQGELETLLGITAVGGTNPVIDDITDGLGTTLTYPLTWTDGSTEDIIIEASNDEGATASSPQTITVSGALRSTRTKK